MTRTDNAEGVEGRGGMAISVGTALDAELGGMNLAHRTEWDSLCLSPAVSETAAALAG
jgi:hypothetical protein